MKRGVTLSAILILLAGFTSAQERLSDRERAIHALNRLAFGSRPGDVDRVMKMGVDVWIAQQLSPERIPDRAVESRLRKFETLKMSDAEIVKEIYRPMIEARRSRASAPVEDRHSCLSGREGTGKSACPPSLREMRQKSRQVIGDLTSQRIIRAAESERQLNEVMVDFWMNHFNVFAGKGLDRALVTGYERDTIRPHIWGSFEDLLMATAKAPAMMVYLDNARSRAEGVNENYAREIMELHTLGVDGGYAQKDVTELARVLTGWSIDRSGEFVFRRALHDRGPKSVLGMTYRAGGGIDEGERMIRFLARHPSTARHISYKLCQRLVIDEPSPELVDRVSKQFLASGGDLRQTVKAVIDSPEFWSRRSYRAKVKSPFEYTVSAIRALGARVDDPLPLARELQKMGEPLYFSQPPTGYADTSDAWVSSGALLNRLNFALALAANKMPGVNANAAALSRDVDLLLMILIGGDVSKETRATIKKRGDDPVVMAGLVLGSPEFQKQ